MNKTKVFQNKGMCKKLVNRAVLAFISSTSQEEHVKKIYISPAAL